MSIEEIVNMEGNRFCLKHGPNLLIIPTIHDAEALMARLRSREKKDNAMFENLAFQLRIKPMYEGDTLREIFERLETIVRYIDAGISVEESKRQAVAVFEERFPNLRF